MHPPNARPEKKAKGKAAMRQQGQRGKAAAHEKLRHPEPIDSYLRRRTAEAEAIRVRIKASQPPRTDLRVMLMECAAQ